MAKMYRASLEYHVANTGKMPVPPGGAEPGIKPALIAVGVFLILWLPAAIYSRAFPEADGCTHYLCARFAFQIPSNFVDMWGRPVCTALYAVPAVLAGRLGDCAISALVAIGCGIVSFRMARLQGDRLAALAMIFTLAQPMLFIHSLSAMTELPFALMLGGAFLAFTTERWWVVALLASLMPLTRPEGFGFILIAAAALVWRRKIPWLAILPLPLLIWDVGGWLIQGRVGPWWYWGISQWPWSEHSMYLPGDPLTFIVELPIVVSPLILPATLLGIWRSVKEKGHFRLSGAAIALFVLAVHTLLYASGKLGSYGEARYLLIAAPFWGVLSARGWQWCFDRLQWPSTFRWAAFASLAPLILNALHPIIPLREPPSWAMADRVASWYTGSNVRRIYPHLLCSHIGIFYAMDISPSNQSMRSWTRETIGNPPPKTLLIWEPRFAPRNANSDRAVSLEDVRKAGWVEETDAPPLLGDPPDLDWHIFHSPEGGE